LRHIARPIGRISQLQLTCLQTFCASQQTIKYSWAVLIPTPSTSNLVSSPLQYRQCHRHYRTSARLIIFITTQHRTACSSHHSTDRVYRLALPPPPPPAKLLTIRRITIPSPVLKQYDPAIKMTTYSNSCVIIRKASVTRQVSQSGVANL